MQQQMPIGIPAPSGFAAPTQNHQPQQGGQYYQQQGAPTQYPAGQPAGPYPRASLGALPPNQGQYGGQAPLHSMQPMANHEGAPYQQYPHQQQPSPAQYQQGHQPQPMQQSMQQSMQQPMQQSMQQPMAQSAPQYMPRQPSAGGYQSAPGPGMPLPGYTPGPGMPLPGYAPGPGMPLPGASYPTAADPRAGSVSSGRISASAVPSPVAVNEADQELFNRTTSVTSTLGSINPPLPSTMARYVDDGNSSARFLRMTTYNVACSEDIMHSTRIPLALIMQPFAQRPPYEDPIPLVDFGPEGPVRCSRCRAYMNPFMSFGQGGRSYQCNICYMNNDVRDSHFCNIDMSGRRTDCLQRPELACGTIDVVAPLDYLLKKPSKAAIIFALESSKTAIQNGAFMAYVQTIKEFLSNPQTVSRYSRVAIVTFDKNVQFYDLRSSLNEPQVLIMSDIADPFIPLNEGLFFDPVASKDMAQSLLDRLPKLFQENRHVDACFGAAATACFEALKATGGRVVLMASSLPSAGLGTLKPKDLNATVASADKIAPYLVHQGEFYRDLAKKCAQNAVAVDIIATPTSSIDMATIIDLCKYTSGTSCVYPKWSFDTHMKKLSEETVKRLLLPVSYDCIAKVRCGSGLQNDLNFGRFVTTEGGDLKFACLDSEQSFATTFTFDTKLPDKEKICFQLAILYNTADGEPRIRIHNLALPCSMDVSNLFKTADLDAIVNLQVKQSAQQFQEQPLPFIATQISSKCAHVLAAYRKHCATTTSTGQLVLPESLKLLPLYSSCIIKQAPFIPNTHVDLQVSVADRLISAAIDSLPSLLYPRLFALHNILDCDQGRYYPPCTRLAKEYIELHGVYLLENSERLIIWVGQQADSAVLDKIFGVSQLSNLNANLVHLPDLNNEMSKQIRVLLQKLQHQRAYHLALSVIRNGLDPWEHEWSQLIVEEPIGQSLSYVDFLCRTHGQIQTELTTGPSLTERAAMLSFMH